MELLNLSPFAVERLVVGDPSGREMLLIIVKATYAVADGGLRLHDEQDAIRLADEYLGEPGKSSIKHAGESALFKPATDVIVIGHAHTPKRKAPQVDVHLKLGALSKDVRVFGDRQWRSRLGMLSMTDPEPFDRMPLVFERAFGGMDDSVPEHAESCAANPVGVGFHAKKSKRPAAGSALPNLENPAELIRKVGDRPAPAGLGFVCPHWEPRIQHAGTYGDAWRESRAPMLPDDFNPAFHQVAPADQIYRGYVEGGERVEVTNVSASGRLAFRLPAGGPRAVVKMMEDLNEPPLNLDTVIIDGDRECVLCVWRGSLPVHNRVYDVEWIKVAERAAT